MSVPPASRDRLAQAGRVLTLLVSNAIKLGGLWIAVHEIATQSQPRLSILAAALFMMTGAQVSEQAIIRLAARMFGGDPMIEPPDKPPGKR